MDESESGMFEAVKKLERGSWSRGECGGDHKIANESKSKIFKKVLERH